MDVEEIFERGIELHHYANTAYPLNGTELFKEFRVNRTDVHDVAPTVWEDTEEMGLYVHVPFCEIRCNFCEYTVVQGEEADRKNEYVDFLVKEIEMYEPVIKDGTKTIIGLDVGGGTPSFASIASLDRIVDVTMRNHKTSKDFAISIETTPVLGTDYKRMRAIRNLGIERMSMGVQTINPKILKQINRVSNTVQIIQNATKTIRDAGFEKFNIDVMYGLPRQTTDIFAGTLQFVMDQNPDYITLYRTRFKGTRIENLAHTVSLDDVNDQFAKASELLNENGYYANIGKTTFSKIKDDVGTSAYLTKRVIEGTPYLGMGIGAQSYSDVHIAYNHGGASKRFKTYGNTISRGHFPVQDLYLLPQDEIMAKMTSVSFYFGYINTVAFKKKFGVELRDQFPNEVAFLEDRAYMEQEGDLFQLTKAGKDQITGIIPLFYSERSKENLMNYERDEHVRLR